MIQNLPEKGGFLKLASRIRLTAVEKFDMVPLLNVGLCDLDAAMESDFSKVTSYVSSIVHQVEGRAALSVQWAM